MAGRPVVVRAGGGGGALYGLVTFAIISVASLGGLIWQATSNQRLADEAAAANRRVQQFGSPPAYFQDEANARQTSVFAVVKEDFESLARLVTGRADAVRPGIEAESNRLLAEVARATDGAVHSGDTLLTAIQKLNRTFVQTKEMLAQLQADQARLRAENENLSQGVKAAREEFQAQVADLQKEVERLNREQAEAIAAKDRQLREQQEASEALGEEFSRLRVERQQIDRQTEIETERLRRTINDLQSKIEDLKPAGFDVHDILTKADGKILRAIPGSDVVYINLGEKDRIRPGMTFVVFSPFGDRMERPRGRSVDDRDYLGKASIEVSAVMSDTAECRVLRTAPGLPIIEGDIIVNIAYERNRLPKFVIRGEFDLNYDGQVDWDGVERVTAMIREWGGQVQAELDETTDFVIIGRGPQLSTLRGDRPVSPVVRDLVETQQRARDEFFELIERARTLYIPVINQNQFLFLTGSFGTDRQAF